MYLTCGQVVILEALRKGQELDCARPGGWRLGDRRIGAKLAWSLLRQCLIRSTGGDEALEHYTISDRGRQALEGKQEDSHVGGG